MPLMSYFEHGFPALYNYTDAMTREKLHRDEKPWPAPITTVTIGTYLQFYQESGLLPNTA